MSRDKLVNLTTKIVKLTNLQTKVIEYFFIAQSERVYFNANTMTGGI
ncbi:MAG: hypothetical protein QF552_07040 [Litorilituus sp.]|jgi:hypothetical protein|nr:hypothetical protein [Litorilituus sp.]